MVRDLKQVRGTGSNLVHTPSTKFHLLSLTWHVRRKALFSRISHFSTN